MRYLVLHNGMGLDLTFARESIKANVNKDLTNSCDAYVYYYSLYVNEIDSSIRECLVIPIRNVIRNHYMVRIP